MQETPSVVADVNGLNRSADAITRLDAAESRSCAASIPSTSEGLSEGKWNGRGIGLDNQQAL